MENLTSFITLLIALSVASERLVDILKNAIPKLNEKYDDPKREGWRKGILQVLALVAGIITVLLTRPAIVEIVPGPWKTFPGLIALGLLTSGGSGLWNSVLTYVLNAKDIKREMAKKLRSSQPSD